MRHGLFFLLLVILPVFGLSSCSNGFRQEWSAAVSKPIPSQSIEGPWQGTWRSEVNGHHGKLRAIVPPAQGVQREIFYHATWARILSGSMKAAHETKASGKGVVFTARHTLGRLGEFTARGTITPKRFSARYSAAGDHGVFEMTRPTQR